MNCSTIAKKRAYAILAAFLTLVSCIIQFCRGVKDGWEILVLILLIFAFFFVLCDIFKEPPSPGIITEIKSFTQKLKELNNMAVRVNDISEEARLAINEFKKEY